MKTFYSTLKVRKHLDILLILTGKPKVMVKVFQFNWWLMKWKKIFELLKKNTQCPGDYKLLLGYHDAQLHSVIHLTGCLEMSPQGSVGSFMCQPHMKLV